MSAGTTEEKDKRALYWLGDRLIDHRHPIMIVVLGVTAVFAYWAFQMKLETSFGDLLPQTHPFIQIHNKYAGTFGGANNVQLMVEAKDGNIFNVPTLACIYKITEAVDQVYGVNHNQIDSIRHRAARPRALGGLPAGGAGHDRPAEDARGRRQHQAHRPQHGERLRHPGLARRSRRAGTRELHRAAPRSPPHPHRVPRA